MRAARAVRDRQSRGSVATGREVGGGVTYQFGDHTACFLYPTPNAGTSKASQGVWQVDDVEREVADLTARGLTFEEYDMPGLTTDNDIVTARRRQIDVVQGSRGQHPGPGSDASVNRRFRRS